MTLIPPFSRVHFADGVLEEALSLELQPDDPLRPLLVFEPHIVSCTFSERVIASLPPGCESTTHGLPNMPDSSRAMTVLQHRIQHSNTNVVVAFGSCKALWIADACCRLYSATREEPSTATDLIVIPGVDGVPTMSMRRYDSDNAPGGGIQPKTVIVDPTLIVGESVERTASAIADAMARCLSAFFSDTNNRPAERVAREGIKRIKRNLPNIVTEDTVDMRRELMAASLNGALATEEESGIANELSKIFLSNPNREIDKGALMRLLIIIEADLHEQNWPKEHCREICTALGVPGGTKLRVWLSAILGQLQLPASLSQLGLSAEEVSQAAEELVARNLQSAPSAERLTEMLNRVKIDI